MPQVRHFMLLVLLNCLLSLAHAQATGLLYDPQPPADSAYVRVIHAAQGKNIDIKVNDKIRISALKSATASDYMVLPAGRQIVTVHSSQPTPRTIKIPVEVIAGRSFSLVLSSLSGEGKTLLLTDKANGNKMKAVLTAYHLAPELGKIDILTTDGTKVFGNLSAETASHLSVNPIQVTLGIHQSNDKQPLSQTTLNMDYGGTYSLLIMSGDKGKTEVHAIQNKVERYTGK